LAFDDRRKEGVVMKVFISHGHDELVRRKVADFVRYRLGLQAVVLVEETTPGSTIVEKLEAEARDADCALILVTADDVTREGSVRARQNVIHEIGYFQGLLGRKRVVIVAQEGVEWFSNLAGIDTIQFTGSNVEAKFEDVRRAIGEIQELSPRPPHAVTWTLTAEQPAALVQVRRAVGTGPAGSPVVYGANQAFLDFFEHVQGIPDLHAAAPLTLDTLLSGLQRTGHVTGLEAFTKDQQSFFESVFMPTPPVRARSPLSLRNHPRYGSRNYDLYLVGRGIVDDADTALFASCLVTYLEHDEAPGLNLGRVSLDSLKSQNVITVVLSKRHVHPPEPPTIKVVSRDAAKFYGYSADAADRLKGKTLVELLEILKKYMNRRDFAAFAEDQKRVGMEYAEYERAWARVPIRFNNDHPDEGFKNQTFYPIISHAIEDVEDYIHVLYVNLPSLLKNLRKGMR
jgi:hypothetical protein